MSSVRQFNPTWMILVFVLLMVVAVGKSVRAPHPSVSPQFQMVAQPVMEEKDDYGIWNPAPYFGGGGDGAPVPHVKAAFSSWRFRRHFQLPFPHFT